MVPGELRAAGDRDPRTGRDGVHEREQYERTVVPTGDVPEPAGHRREDDVITRDCNENTLTDGEVDERRKTRIAQVLVLFLAIGSYVIAIQDVDIIVMVTLVAFDGLTQTLPIVLGALYWRRASKAGALSGLGSGTAVAAVLTFGIVTLPAAAPDFTPGLYGLIVNTVLFVGVSLLTDPVPAENRERTQGYIRYAVSREWETETPADD